MTDFVTLTALPSYPLEPDGDIEDSTLRSETEGGYRQTRPRFTRSRRKWGLNYIDLDDTDATALRTFERTTLRNGADKFNWTHPMGGTYVVTLAGPIKFARRDFGGTNATFTLEEV